MLIRLIVVLLLWIGVIHLICWASILIEEVVFRIIRSIRKGKRKK